MGSSNTPSLASSVAPLLAGNGAAQVVGIASLPLLARLYPPEAFGILACFAAASMLGGLLVTGRYELAIPVVHSDDEARELVSLSTTLGVLVSTPLLAIAILATARSDGPLTSAFALAAPSLLLTSVYQPLSYWFSRRSRFHAVAISRTLQAAGAAIAQLGAGLAGFTTSLSLIAGALVGQAAGTACLSLNERRLQRPANETLRSRVGLRRLAARFRDFPRYAMPSGWLQVAADQAPLLAIPFLFGSEVAGAYALPARVLFASVALFSGSAAQAFFPAAARARDERSLGRACLALQRNILRWAATPLLVIAVVAPEAADRVLGAEWADSATWFRILVPTTLAAFTFGPIMLTFNVRGRLLDALVIHAVLVSSTLATLLLGAALFEVKAAILLFSIVGAIVRVAGVELAVRGAGGPSWRSLQTFLEEVARAIPAVAVAWAARSFLASSSASLSVAAIVLLAHVFATWRSGQRKRPING